MRFGCVVPVLFGFSLFMLSEMSLKSDTISSRMSNL